MASRQITQGPGKFDLMLALFDFQKVRFSFEKITDQFPARISSVRTEDRETETWTIQGFNIHYRPIQEFQDFTATYSTDTRQGSATFQDTCKTCKGPLDEKGFCERCAPGGLPLKVCAEIDLQTVPPGGKTIGFGVTAEEHERLRSTGRVTLKNRVTVGLRPSQHVYLYKTPGNTFVDMQARVMRITPPPPAESPDVPHTADVEIIS